jgi:hypothetical protein
MKENLGAKSNSLHTAQLLLEWFEVAIFEGFYPGFGATSNTKALAFV